MYKKDIQMAFEDFVFPFGDLDPENEWVKLSDLIPWDIVEQEYAKHFVDNGHPAHPARVALGALIIKQRLKCSDEWTVRHVSENPYLQFFLGMKQYTSRVPFGASTMVDFRKRFPPEAITAILEASMPQRAQKKDDNPSKPTGGGGKEAEVAEEETPQNEGTLLMDATCCPADITFPQDFQLLNHARELLEDIVRAICRDNKWKMPRMYAKRARQSYLNLSRCKKRSAKAVRKCIKQQLQFIRRDIGYVADFIRNKGVRLEQKVYELLNTLTTLYEQQLYMHEHRVHSIQDRIVSIRQPWVRPIVRGKSHANTEFGAKLHISMVNGYARIERLSFDAFNESTDFFQVIEGYRKQCDFYPARVLADKIYRNRETLAWCKERHIQLTGPALGRPFRNPEQTRAARRQEYQDICDRNIVEGEFGTGKRAYGLNRIMARLPETSFFFCFDLLYSLRQIFCSRGWLNLVA